MTSTNQLLRNLQLVTAERDLLRERLDYLLAKMGAIAAEMKTTLEGIRK